MQVTLLNTMGNDLTVVNAARVSFDKESSYSEDAFGWTLPDKDEKLIAYLAKHKHWTPFGHIFASFRIKAPLFVARQLGKHQVGLVWNEVSRRYVDSEPEFYEPNALRLRAENVKQGSSEETVTQVTHHFDSESKWDVSEALGWVNDTALETYTALIKDGVCPEQARMVLPQSMYTEWIWSGSVAAFARVCKLRLDPHTQKETQHIAQQIDNELSTVFPCSWSALLNG